MSGNIDEPTLARIERSLHKTGVYVSPDLRDDLTQRQLTRIQAARHGTPQTAYVIAVNVDYEDPIFHGNADALIDRIHDDTHQDGLYLVAGSEFGDGYQLDSKALPEDSSAISIGTVATDEHGDNLGAMILDGLALAKSGDADARAEKMFQRDTKSYQQHNQHQSDRDDGGNGAAITTGIVGGVVVVALLALLVRRRRGPSVAATGSLAGSATTATTASTQHRQFTLPPAVLSTVRAAEDRQNEHRAQADVLALGEAIDNAELSASSDRVRAAWQAALDHYDVARRILDRDHSPADAIGAIVLAGRGRAALDAALRKRGWKPAKPCYFNPLHGTARQSVTWGDGDRGVSVPACAACARSVRARQEPADVLDFVADGVPRHYFALDLGVWSATGYGALDTDLLGRLLER